MYLLRDCRCGIDVFRHVDSPSLVRRDHKVEPAFSTNHFRHHNRTGEAEQLDDGIGYTFVLIEVVCTIASRGMLFDRVPHQKVVHS